MSGHRTHSIQISARITHFSLVKKNLDDFILKILIKFAHEMMMNTVCRLFYFYFITREKYVQVDLLQVAHV